jgi:hypothetical protein
VHCQEVKSLAINPSTYVLKEILALLVEKYPPDAGTDIAHKTGSLSKIYGSRRLS